MTDLSICPGCGKNWRLHRPQGNLDCPWRFAPAAMGWIKLPDELQAESMRLSEAQGKPEDGLEVKNEQEY